MPLPISNSRHVAVAEGGRTRVVAVADLAAALGVDALIRLHRQDFEGLAGIGRDLVHFNLERTINRAGAGGKCSVCPSELTSNLSPESRET